MQPTPDLQEFLSALNGFLSRPATPADPGYVRFLEIFFRSVKANRGHLLRVSDAGILQSSVSFGLPEDFDEEYNRLRRQNHSHPSPLDNALMKGEAIAIVDLHKESSIPEWFMTLMNKHHFCSMVAVPLVGKSASIGVLCAYYEDVCLFDEGTLNHLLVMGRMVGGASEKNMQVASAEYFGEKERWLDQYLNVLTMQKIGRLDVYKYASKMVQQGLQVNGVIAGPVTLGAHRALMAIADGKGISEKSFSKDLELPERVVEELKSGEWNPQTGLMDIEHLGELKRFFNESQIAILARPLMWNGDIRGAIVAWRIGGPLFDKNDFTLLSRLSGITSLALHAF